MAYNPYLGPPIPVDPSDTDPAEPGTIEPIKPPRPNPAISRSQRLRDFLSANPGRRGPQMGRNEDGSIAYDPSVYGSAGTMPDPRVIGAPVGRPSVGPQNRPDGPGVYTGPPIDFNYSGPVDPITGKPINPSPQMRPGGPHIISQGGGEGIAKPIGYGEGSIKPPYTPGPNAPQGPFDKSRLLAAIGRNRPGGP